jgi:hypothetical protein
VRTRWIADGIRAFTYAEIRNLPTSLEHIGNHPVIVGGGFAPDLPFEPRPPHRRDYHEAEEVTLLPPNGPVGQV